MKVLAASAYIILVALLCRCENRDYPTIIDTRIDFWIRDKKGDNLLNSGTAGYFRQEDIRVSYLEDGQEKEFFDPRLDAPRNFFIYENESNGEFALRLFPYNGKSSRTEITTTYLKWREALQDTVTCEIVKINNSHIIRKVWYNGILRHDGETAQNTLWGNSIMFRFIEVVK
jgi:hypothetical protein